MGSYCAIGSVKGQILPMPTLKGKLSIPPYTHCSHEEYDGEYTIIPEDEPYLFLELTRNVSTILRKKFVVLKVRAEDFIPHK